MVTMRWARLKLWSISANPVSGCLDISLGAYLPCRVNVMDCSSFSSSSVSVRPRDPVDILGLDIFQKYSQALVLV